MAAIGPSYPSFPLSQKELEADDMSESTIVSDEGNFKVFHRDQGRSSIRVLFIASTLAVLFLTTVLAVSVYGTSSSPSYKQLHRTSPGAYVPVTAPSPLIEAPSQLSNSATGKKNHDEGLQWLQNCGNSTLGSIHARALGCKFDVMSFSWLPPACFDEDLTTTFQVYTSGPSMKTDSPGMYWKWWLDPNGVHEVPAALVMQGEFEELYVDFEYHLVHCTYMWRKMHRALLRASHGEMSDHSHARAASNHSPVILESYLLNMNHTNHCERMIVAGVESGKAYNASKIDGSKIGTAIKRKFPDCVRI